MSEKVAVGPKMTSRIQKSTGWSMYLGGSLACIPRAAGGSGQTSNRRRQKKKILSLLKVLEELLRITVEQEELEKHISFWKTEDVIASRGPSLTSSLSPPLPCSYIFTLLY